MDKKGTGPKPAESEAQENRGPIEVQIHLHDSLKTVVRIRETGTVTIANNQTQNAHGLSSAVWRLTNILMTQFHEWLKRGKQGPYKSNGNGSPETEVESGG